MQSPIGEDGDFRERDRNADRARLLVEIVRRLGDRAGTFCHTVQLTHAVAWPDGEKAPFDLGRADRGPGGEEPEP